MGTGGLGMEVRQWAQTPGQRTGDDRVVCAVHIHNLQLTSAFPSRIEQLANPAPTGRHKQSLKSRHIPRPTVAKCGLNH